MTELDEDEQFYRDTESIAFPKLDDRQLAMLEPLGARRIVRRGELVYKAGQRDLGLTVVLRGELEVFESRDGQEQILATAGPRDFIGDVAMLMGTAALASARGKADESEILEVPADRLRQALAELPGVSEPIVRAFIMRRQRLKRDREFAGLRIVAQDGSRDGRQLDDFLDKNHIPHRLIDFQSEDGRALCERLHLASRDLPALITANGMPLRRPSLREVARVAGLLRPLAQRGGERNHLRPRHRRRGSGRSCRRGLCRIRRAEDRGSGKLRAGRTSRILLADREFFRLSHRHQRRRSDLRRAASGLSFRREVFHARAGALARIHRGRAPREPASRGLQRHPAARSASSSPRARITIVWRPRGARTSKAPAFTTLPRRGKGKLCRGSTVIVAGGGNSAGQAAMFLSEGAEKVLLVIRGEGLAKSMSSYLSRRVEAKENIEILAHTEIRKMMGGKVLEAVELENTQTHERRTVQTPAVFSMIGAKPCTAWLPPEIERDEKGFIKTGHAVADAPAWKGDEPFARAAGDEPAGHLCRGRRALRLGETLRRRSGRRRHGGRGRARGPQNLRLNAHRPRSQGSELEWRFAFCLIKLWIGSNP